MPVLASNGLLRRKGASQVHGRHFPATFAENSTPTGGIHGRLPFLGLSTSFCSNLLKFRLQLPSDTQDFGHLFSRSAISPQVKH